MGENIWNIYYFLKLLILYVGIDIIGKVNFYEDNLRKKRLVNKYI